MADKVLIEFQIVQKGKQISVVQKETDKLAKSTDRAEKATKKNTKATDKYNRVAKGAAGISSNQTKNFSKMQQSVDGGEGGGSGGLVRAYALLAANVFALSAAFGVLSRSAQVDTLTASIEKLEVVSGKSIRSVARDLQEASGFSLDFASSLRSTSLALSAGFEADNIRELGEVAKNAAVSLGRPLADALDRIFRGVIKVEPELLDEIGLFVRVDEAASRYADSIGVATSELTEFQKRTAFAQEAIEQGTKKFAAFSDIDPDAFAKLGASFFDLAQDGLSLVNRVLVPIIQYLEENKGLLIGLFAAIGLSILKSIVPAMGQFRLSARKAATEATEDFEKFKEEIAAGAAAQKANAIAAQENAVKADKAALKTAQSTTKKTRAYQSEAKGLKLANAELAKASTLGEKSAALDTKIIALEKSKATAKGSTRKIISDNVAALKAEKIATEDLIASELKLTAIQNAPDVAVKAKKGSFMNLEEIRLQKVALRSLALENVSTTASNEGLRAGFARLKLEMAGLPPITAANAVGFGSLARASFYLSGALTIVSIKLSELMMKLAPFMPFIMVLVLAFPMLTKAMGFGSKSAEEYSAALDKTAEMLDNFREKLINANEVLNNNDSSMEAQVDAQIAFRRAISETSQTLLEQKGAYDKYVQDTNQFVRFFGDFGNKGAIKLVKDEVTALGETLMEVGALGSAGEGILLEAISTEDLAKVKELNAKRVETAEKIEKSQERLARIQREMNSGVRFRFNEELGFNEDLINLRNREHRLQRRLNKEIKNDRKEINKIAQEGTKLVTEEGTLFGRLTKQQSEGADAMENSKSAIDGAIDSARAFKKQFITKSDVDKPLASFRQISTALELQNDKGEKTKLLTEDRATLLERIEDTKNDIITLMSKENREAFRNADTEKEKLKIIANQRDIYAKSRVTQLATKNLLNEIKQIEKSISAIRKETIVGINKGFSLQKQERDLQLEIKKANLSNVLTAANLTRAEAERLSKLKVNSELVEKIVEAGGKEGEGLTAVLQIRELNLALIQQEIDAKTEGSKKEIEVLNLLSKRLKAQEKLNSLTLESSKLSRQIGFFGEGGGTSLNNTRSQELLIEGERVRLKTAEKRAEIEKALIKAQYAILKTELAVLNEKKQFAGIQGFNFEETMNSLMNAEEILIKSIDQGLENAADNFMLSLLKGFEKGFSNFTTEIGGAAASNSGLNTFIDQLTLGDTTLSKLQQNKQKLLSEQKDLQDKLNNLRTTDSMGGVMPGAGAVGQLLVSDLQKVEQGLKSIDMAMAAMNIDLATAALMRFSDQLSKLGTGGELAASLATFSAAMLQSFTAMGQVIETEGATKVDKFVAAANAMSTVIAGFSSVLQADTKNRIANIDQAIEAEKRLDGKSAQSVQKIKQMEAKKEQIAKKSFETNKKLQIAQAIISTAAGAAAAYAIPVIGPALAAMIVALGMAQVAIIKKTSYQSTGGDVPAPNTSLSIGSRGSAVDTAQNATGGELNYLRGGDTSGTNLGGAGGAMGRKGYANGGEGIVVGERGPEIITPTEPVDITPNFALGGGTTNVNFSINAVDATGVEDLLVNQRGNIIRMIREAANENGEDFLTQVDPMAYGSNS
jgi:hypothetical protein